MPGKVLEMKLKQSLTSENSRLVKIRCKLVNHHGKCCNVMNKVLQEQLLLLKIEDSQ